MAFTKAAKADTINSCRDLKIIDLATYDETYPKTAFTARTITLTKADGTEEVVAFPYDNTDNEVQDSLTIEDYFDRDYFVSIKISWTYDISSVPVTEAIMFNYISSCHSRDYRTSLAQETYELECEKDYDDLIMIGRLIDEAENAALTFDGVVCQYFLDRINSLKDTGFIS